MSDIGRLAQATSKSRLPLSRSGDYKAAQTVDPLANDYQIKRGTPGDCYVRIDKQTSDGTTSLFDFQDLPQTFSDLRVRIMGALDIGAGGVGAVYMQFNGDAGENYREIFASMFDSISPLTIPEILVEEVDPDIGFDLPGPTFSGFSFPQAPGIVEVLIAEYTSPFFWKPARGWGLEMATNGDGTRYASTLHLRGGFWMNLDPITSIQVGTVTELGGGGGGEFFIEGTTCTLHGIC